MKKQISLLLIAIALNLSNDAQAMNLACHIGRATTPFLRQALSQGKSELSPVVNAARSYGTKTSAFLAKAVTTIPTRALTTPSTDFNSEQMKSNYGWWNSLKNATAAQWVAAFLAGGALMTGSVSAEEESPFDKTATEDLLNNISKYVEKLQKAKNKYIWAKSLQNFFEQISTKNIDINAKDEKFIALSLDGSGNTLLHYAVLLGDKYLVEHLIEKGANINISNDLGNTPLILAAKEQNLIIVKILLENGADANIRGIAYLTAIDYLDHYSSNTEIGRLLKERTTVPSVLSEIR